MTLLRRFQRKLIKIVLFLLTVLSIIYPFCIVFKSEFTYEVIILLAFFWFIRGVLENKIFILLSLFFLAIFAVKDLKYFYPVVVNLGLFVFFAISLKGESLITKLAKLKDKNLSEFALIYTRKLTKIWIIFFLLNALISFLLVFINLKMWAFYTGFISYVFIGALFGGEILYRKLILKV